MPFADYRDHAHCVAENSDKEDPDAYCAAIENETMKASVNITKVDSGRRMFGGWAYVAKTADGTQLTDHSGDVVDDEAWDWMEKAFVNYALESRAGDHAHATFGASQLVEMFISTPERRAALGIPDGVLPDRGVYVSYRADDTPEGEALWQDVQGGGMLSIVGRGRRVPA